MRRDHQRHSCLVEILDVDVFFVSLDSTQKGAAMPKEKVMIPELEEACENRMDRYVEASKLTYQYSLRYYEIKRIARECNSFKMMRRQSLVDYAKFDAYIASFFREENEQMKRIEEMNDPKLCEEVNLGNKKYVRYNEGAYLYSISKRNFTDLAKKADAIRKIGGVSLVSVAKLNEYIEGQFS